MGKTELGTGPLHYRRNITLPEGEFVAKKVFALKCRIGTSEIAENSKPEQIIMKQFHHGADARKRVSSDGQATPGCFLQDIELSSGRGGGGGSDVHNLQPTLVVRLSGR